MGFPPMAVLVLEVRVDLEVLFPVEDAGVLGALLIFAQSFVGPFCVVEVLLLPFGEWYGSRGWRDQALFLGGGAFPGLRCWWCLLGACAWVCRRW